MYKVATTLIKRKARKVQILLVPHLLVPLGKHNSIPCKDFSLFASSRPSLLLPKDTRLF